MTRLVCACVFAFALGGLAACGSDDVAAPQVPDAVAGGDAEPVGDGAGPSVTGVGADWPKEVWLPDDLTAMTHTIGQFDGKTAASLTGMVMISRDEMYQQIIDAVGRPDTEESTGRAIRLQYSTIMTGHSVNYILQGDPAGDKTTLVVTANAAPEN